MVISHYYLDSPLDDFSNHGSFFIFDQEKIDKELHYLC